MGALDARVSLVQPLPSADCVLGVDSNLGAGFQMKFCTGWVYFFAKQEHTLSSKRVRLCWSLPPDVQFLTCFRYRRCDLRSRCSHRCGDSVFPICSPTSVLVSNSRGFGWKRTALRPSPSPCDVHEARTGSNCADRHLLLVVSTAFGRVQSLVLTALLLQSQIWPFA